MSECLVMWLYDLCQVDCMLVDEVNSMSNGQGTMVHGHGVLQH